MNTRRPGDWKRNPMGLWVMIGAGVGRILWTGAGLVLGRLRWPGRDR